MEQRSLAAHKFAYIWANGICLGVCNEDARSALVRSDYPKERWVHLHTSNPVESIFAGARLRTNAANRMRQREAPLYLVFKIVGRLSGYWRGLKGGETLMALFIERRVFRDGKGGLRREGTAAAHPPRIANSSACWNGISKNFDTSSRNAPTSTLRAMHESHNHP